MHIIYIIDDVCNSGGMERVLATKANYLVSKLGYEVSIISKNGQRKIFFQFAEGVKLYFLNLPTGWRGKRAYRHRLQELLMTLHADIVISMFGSELRFLHKINDGSRKILEFHYSYSYLTDLVKGIHGLRFRTLHLLKVRWMALVDRHHVPFYDAFVVLSEQDRQAWLATDPRTTAIPNPLSFSELTSGDLTSTRIIAAGRFTAQKGFDLLIEAFALLAKRYPQWSLDIFGAGPDYNYLQDCINRFSLVDQVRLNPTSSNIRHEMLQCSIFAFSSRYEGFGLVLTEAMACGIPCVSFDCKSGPGEILTQGEDGYLVACYDIVGFSNALETLMISEKKRAKMGAHARENVKRFLPENIMLQWDRLFHEVINGSK